MNNNNFELERFIDAQKYGYQTALSEIIAGEKKSHWIWYIFPQIVGLGRSSQAEKYGIKSLDEAKAYLENNILGSRLIEISNELLKLQTNDAYAVFGSPDNMKLKSCMTLFSLADPTQTVFSDVLEKYFNGNLDRKTLNLLNL